MVGRSGASLTKPPFVAWEGALTSSVRPRHEFVARPHELARLAGLARSHRRWPGVPVFNDARALRGSDLSDRGLLPDVVCGGLPCQDISTTGKGAGIDGE